MLFRRRVAMHLSKIVHHYLVVFIALSCTSGCATDDDPMPLNLESPRCSKAGICVFATGGKSLQGAFRENDDELKFDVLYRPYHGLSVGEVYPWCVRLIDQKNQEFFFADNGHCPAAWYRKDFLHQLSGDESYIAYTRRDQLTSKLRQKLAQVHPPEGREKALGVLRDTLNTHLRSVTSSDAIDDSTLDSDANIAAEEGAVLGYLRDATASDDEIYSTEIGEVTLSDDTPDEDGFLTSEAERSVGHAARDNSRHLHALTEPPA